MTRALFPRRFRLVFPESNSTTVWRDWRPTLSGRCEGSGSQEEANISTRKGLWEGNGGAQFSVFVCVFV